MTPSVSRSHGDDSKIDGTATGRWRVGLSVGLVIGCCAAAAVIVVLALQCRKIRRRRRHVTSLVVGDDLTGSSISYSEAGLHEIRTEYTIDLRKPGFEGDTVCTMPAEDFEELL
jgi:hypothetical protein